MKPSPPTTEQFSAYQGAWEYFNAKLFDGTLQPCLLNFSRHRGAYGFFTQQRWQKDSVSIHEISLNPDLLNCPAQESLSTLVHEMCHQWQQDHGKPSRGGYHNTQWACKMKQVGLIPSSTGEPGGKQTGQRVSHYIEDDGAFIQAFTAMPKDCLLPWTSGASGTKTKAKGVKKIRLTCPECEMHVWIEAENLGRQIDCGDCGMSFLTKEEMK